MTSAGRLAPPDSSLPHTVSVRPATVDDLPAVADLYRGYVLNSVSTFEESPPDVPAWQRKFEDIAARGLPFLVAEATVAGSAAEEPAEGGAAAGAGAAGAATGPAGGPGTRAVVGYAYAGPYRPKPAYRYTAEDSIYLAPGWTGKGIGRALLTAVLDSCTRAGIRQVIAVIAEPGDGASTALHRAFGFEESGRLVGVGYKLGRWLDTVLLQRTLTAAPPD